MSEKLFGLVKLNNENFFIWKFRMEMLLKKEGLWSAVSIDPPDPVTEKWTMQDEMARATICLSLEDNQLNHVRKMSTSKETWLALKNYHERSTLSNKVQLMRKICSMRLEENGNMEEHINDMMDSFEKLSENWIVAMLLSSLPRSYDTLITALETRPEGDLSQSLVQSKLLEEHSKRKISKENDSVLRIDKVNLKSVKKIADKCFFCKKSGHLKKDCHKY